MPSYEERLKRNDESRSKAEHHAEPWSADELEVLMLWSGSEDELVALAEMVGRTIEACRQKFYMARRGHIKIQTTTVTVTRGWLVGYCFVCGAFTDVFSDGVTAKCEECRDG